MVGTAAARQPVAQALNMAKDEPGNKGPGIEDQEAPDQLAKAAQPVHSSSVTPTSYGRAKKALIPGLLLVLLVLPVFFPMLHNDFINYDDPIYVTGNPHVQGGLTWEDFKWALTTSEGANWHPLTMLSHMLDCQVFGLKPWGHHLTSLLFHAANTLLLFLVLNRLTGARWRSFFVAALFGLHPLRVESVAWVAERKDVLSAFFWLLTLKSYTAYVEALRPAEASPPDSTSRSRGPGIHLYYSLTLLCFILGLLSKPMLVTLPFVLLLLDYWPLNRISNLKSEISNPRPWSRLVWEKTPFFILAAVSSAVTLIVQKHAGAMARMAELTFAERVENAVISYARYLGKFLYPMNLAVFYPHPEQWPASIFSLAGLLLLGLCALAIMKRRQWPWLFVGWFWFVGTLVPVIGLVQVGGQSIADRYTYLPLIGILIALTWGLCEASSRLPSRAYTLPGAAAIAVISCAVLTRRQIGWWQDSGTLFRHVIAATGDNHIAYFHLGDYLLSRGDTDEAIRMYQSSIQTRPTFLEPHQNLGVALLSQARFEPASDQFREALRLKPDFADAHNGLGYALQRQGRLDDALAHFEQAVAADPTFFQAQCNLGNLLASKGRLDESISNLQVALRLQPGAPEAHNSLGIVLAARGRRDEAIAEFTTALKLQPDYSEAGQRLRSLTAPPAP
jgi:protein O-mannosyl-transferase